MTNWQFTLNPSNESLLIDEPIGFADNAFKLERDLKGHGISVLFTDNNLEFTGEAALLLEDYYNKYSLDADCSILVEFICDEEVLFSEEMKFDFGTYNKADCSDCRVSLSFEQDSCAQQFSNNFDKKVNLDTLFTFDQVTPVRELPLLKKYSDLPAKAYLKSSEANVADAGDITAVDFEFPGILFRELLWTCRPIYANSKYESIATTQLANPVMTYSEVLRGEEDIVSPIVLYEEDESCSDGVFDVTIRLKGRVKIKKTGSGEATTNLRLVWCKCQGSYWATSSVQSDLKRVVLAKDIPLTEAEQVYEFDESYTNPAMPLVEGDCLYAFVLGLTEGRNSTENKQVIFDKETAVNIFGKVKCPGSKADLYMPHEVFERLADVITDGCMKFRSSYYGRTELGYAADGEGAGRSVTNGLKLRNAPKAEFTLSMRDYFESNQAIDALGFCITSEADGEVLEVERLDYFYKDEEMLKLASLSQVKLVVEPGNVIGLIKVGYNKWQVEKINGLDEFNSTREFRTTVKNTKGQLEIISKAVTSGYIIELARAENFADSGAADTTYDNETFIIQLVRDELGGFKVEQGGEGTILNVFDPESVYNFRLSPLRMLLRWWSFIAGLSFRKAENGQIIFSSGTGNYLASGLAAGGEQTPETTAAAENTTVTPQLVKESKLRPLVRAETITFEAPLTMAQFLEIRRNPYRYISYQCGEGIWQKGYIKSLTFKLKTLKASIQLINKYD